jgi:hypothetical protein
MIPTWLPDAIGTISSLMLTIPAWRASSLLKVIFSIEREVESDAQSALQAKQALPGSGRRQRGDYVPDEDTANALINAMRDVAARWDPIDDWMLKAGLLLLFVSFVARLLVSVPTLPLG